MRPASRGGLSQRSDGDLGSGGGGDAAVTKIGPEDWENINFHEKERTKAT